jgi:enoyl-CoA hydratase
VFVASVELSFEGSLAKILINRPEALNAINAEVLQGIQKASNELAEMPHIQVVILKSAGDKAFVAGADLKEMSGLTQNEAAEFSAMGAKSFASLANLPQVVIAQIQGFALGGGLELALAADFMIASEKAKFGLPEVSLGLIPGFGGTQRLAARIGTARALEWLVTAEKFSAEHAFQLGLVNKVVVAAELEEHVKAMAVKILANGPSAVRAAKKLVTLSLRNDTGIGYHAESSQFGLRFQAPESTEGISAFLEKRKAEFRR